MKRLKEEEIIKIVNEKNMIFDHMKYENGKGYIGFICEKHKDKGVQFSVIGSFKRSKQPCGYCSNRIITTESFKDEIAKINPNIEILGEYINALRPIKCHCLIDNYMWDAVPNNLKKGEGCPICGRKTNSKKRTKTKNDFIDEISNRFKDEIVLISDYNGARNNVICKCVKHNYEFNIIASNLVNQSVMPCPICRGNATRKRCIKSNKQFLQELKLVNPNIIPLEEYIDDHSKILCKCNIHNYEWYVEPNKILHRRTGCPKCSSYHNENVILDILDKWNYKYIIQKRFDDCKDKNTLPFDIYLEDFNICIEYDGEQHYYPIKRGSMTDEDAEENYLLTVKHDKIKTEYCQKNNIGLIRIPYWENDDMENYLFNKLLKLKAIELIS